MAVLHGSWLIQPLSQTLQSSTTDTQSGRADSRGGCFFIWGETWRRVEPAEPNSDKSVLSHPFVMAPSELLEFLRSLQNSRQLKWPVPDVPLDVPISTGASPKGKRGHGTSRKKSATQTLEPEVVAQETVPRWVTSSLTLPTYEVTSEAGEPLKLPQHSAAQGLMNFEQDAPPEFSLWLWQVQGLYLTPLEAIQFLQSLPLSSVNAEESWLGRDLRYWSHIARWSLDLLARSKFLPGLVRHSDGSAIAHWQALLDSSVDQARLEHFVQAMPPACRTYQEMAIASAHSNMGLKENRAHDFPSSQTLLLSFLNGTTDVQVRQIAASNPLPATQMPKDVPLREWLQALSANGSTQESGQYLGDVAAEPDKLERLEAILSSWVAPIQHQLAQQSASFRTCFYLKTPGPNQTDWKLEYSLQATHDPDFVVDARTIWNNPVDQLKIQGRTIHQPQETLLAGLGFASRLYPVIEPSLQVQQPAFCQLDPMQVYEFIKTTAWQLQESGFGVVLPPSLANQQGLANRLGLRVIAETPSSRKKQQRLGLQSLLNFKWELSIGGQRLTKAEFDRLVALNTPLVEINGEWVELRPQDVRAAQTFFDSRKDQMALSLEDALRISTGDTQTIEKLPVVDFEASGALQDLITTLTTGNESIESIPTPKDFRGELRPYQVRGASWLAFLERWGLGACLADDMGLGKTIQLIALLLHLKEQGVLEQPTLLVCPTSVLSNWEREVKKFGPTLKVLVHHGDKRSQGKAFAKAVKGYDLVITSYALVHRDAKDLQSVSWQGVVLDEAQNVKNSEAKQSQSVRQLESQFRIALTGTPVENRLSELWSILDFLNPGYLGPRNFFQRRFAVPIERYGDTSSLQTLRSLVQPFILRRLKTDRDIIQDLPEKQEMTVFCGLTADQAALYQKLVDQSLVDIESAEGIQRRGMILALLVKLKQVCNHPVLLKQGESGGESTQTLPVSQSEAFRHASGKLQRLEEMLDEMLSEGDRALVFTQFAEWGKVLKAYLEQQLGREILFLYGGSSKKQREEMVDRFQNDPQGPRIFILSLKAGGVGLNLTRANHVFHFDRWWNPAVENQATDRVFRIGQIRNVQVHKFVCTGTLEERIHELIESKKSLSEQVVGAGENWLTELDTEQLRNLLLLDRSAVIDDGGN